MRPEQPLEPMRNELSAWKVKGANNKMKMKKRVKPPPVRARRRLIDPTKWDSVYLKGMFLDNVPVSLPTSRGAHESGSLVKYDIPDEGNEEETDEDSADSNAEGVVHFDHDGGMGLVACQRDIEMEEIYTPVSIKVPAQIAEPAPRTNLKALFAPREDASFSLLDHLDFDLDFDLDVDILGISAPPGASQENDHLSEPILSIPNVVEIPATTTTKSRSRVTLDPSLPLLFPSPGSLPHPYTPSNPTTVHQHGIQACFLFPSATRSRGLYHLPSSMTFTRSPQDTSKCGKKTSPR
ncbi:hypothetical protein HD554DRAFT_4016 [Boletus coccyginus]|nr:hypothetical protein HD554DRAFT_4016 [Boletus coccyginus]